MAYKAKQHYQDEEVAAIYDRVRFRGLGGALVNWLDQRLLMRAVAGIRPGGRILDLPVGTGRMARRLTTEGYQVIGADVSEPMLRLAQTLADEAGQSAAFVRADAEELPFADKALDGAVCFRLMPHLPSQARESILREMGRVAQRVIAVYQPHRVAAWWLWNGLVLRRRLPLHFVSPQELEREFERSGLRLVRSHAMLRWIFTQRAYVLEPDAGPAGSNMANRSAN